MLGRRLSLHLVLWATVFALLLNVAAPLIALGAAQANGLALADVCSVYGVRLPGALPAPRGGDANGLATRLGHDRSDSDSDKTHSVDHCALSALATFAMPDAAVPGVVLVDSVTAVMLVQFSRDIGDAAARWATRLHHGPPVFA